MTVALSAAEAERHLVDGSGDALARDLGVPPRPQVLMQISDEMRKEDPDPHRIARVVATDVALTAAVLRLANSPAYGVSRKVETLDQAVGMLGLKQIGVMVTGLVMRKVLRTDGPQLTRFWDVSAKRSWALAQIARKVRNVDVDVAQTFGLFCDVGIPLMMQRFPGYAQTLVEANQATGSSFTEVEQAAHHSDHALVGALMARSWGASQTVCLAIRLHHDYAVFGDRHAPRSVVQLLAMGLIAEKAIQAFAQLNSTVEWDKGGEAATGALMFSPQDVADWVEQLVDGFCAGVA